MPDGLITPELVLQVAEATEDYVVTPTEFSEIMGTMTSIFAGMAIVGLTSMFLGAITERFTREIQHSSSGVIVMPRIPEEAKGDILFIEYVHDMVKLGEVLTDEEVKQMWEDWKRRGAIYS